jgi:NitT/TauT family transport system substrate-binding protein
MSSTTRTRRTRTALAAALLTVGMVFVAAPAATASSRSSAPTAGVKGCGADSWTNPSNDSPDRAPARCAPNTPAPKPLAARKSLKIGVNNLSSEYVAVLRYAIEHGEFDKENLDVELKVVPSADAFTQAAEGGLDGVYSATNAGMVNAVKAGFDLRWVFGNYSPDPASKTGLWVSASHGKPKSLKSLSGTKIASVAGPGSIIDYPIHEALDKAGVKSSDVELSVLAPADIVTALENGSFKAGWVVDPLWQPLT